ncbi:MAG: tol-pal system protein YbgF [Pseudomonadota bacterium]
MKPSFPWPLFFGILLAGISLVSGCSTVQPVQKNGQGDDLINKLSSINTQIDEIKSRISALEDRAGSQDRTLADLSKAVSAYREQVDNLSLKPLQPATEPSLVKTSDSDRTGTRSADYVEPGILYQEARELMIKENYDGASKLFKEYATRYPGAELADNSLYWLGECYYSEKKFQDAITVFKDLVKRYPKGGKVPDALLKTAYAYLSLDDTDRAHHYLKLLVKQFPFTPSGEKAEQKLKLFQ